LENVHPGRKVAFQNESWVKKLRFSGFGAKREVGLEGPGFGL
jgi:hypothetical protein